MVKQLLIDGKKVSKGKKVKLWQKEKKNISRIITDALAEKDGRVPVAAPLKKAVAKKKSAAKKKPTPKKKTKRKGSKK